MKKLITALTVLGAASASANEPLSLDGITAHFGWDLAATEITTQKIDDGLYVLFGAGGNIAASVGDQGVLVVDDMFPELLPKVNAAIREVGGAEIDFVINTHWHFDHAQGNLGVGPAGSWIVAQEHSAAMMARDNVLNLVSVKHAQKAYPPAALPVISYSDRMSFHFNGGDIDLLHSGPAHTAGDTAVLFRKHKAVHLGDVFNNTGYPYIDADNGGGIDGMIAFCQAVLDELGPDGIVIPGHGPVVDSAALGAYIDMLRTTRARVAALIADGKTLEEVVASKPTADLDATFGPESASLGFVNRVYTSLTK